jgi:hypothetical protein
VVPNHPRRGGSLRAALFSAVLLALLGLVIAWWIEEERRWQAGDLTPQHFARFELNRLEGALDRFRADYAFYPPSRIKLSETGNYNRDDPLDRESLRYLNAMWPRLQWEDGIDWNGNGRVESPKEGGDVILEGDQCLVFFLGGIPDPKAGKLAVRGFSKNPRNPAAPGGMSATWFSFHEERLGILHNNPFPSYLDPLGGRAYAYFSSFGKRNGYNPFGTTDCGVLGVWPYAKSLGPMPEYHNPSTFQLISAGEDGRFGAGTVLPGGKTWTREQADQIDEPGRDDLCNFHDDRMGRRP